MLAWSLPVTLVVYVATARMDLLSPLQGWSFLPAMVFSAVVFFAFNQLRDFQKQERVWQQALGRAEIFAIINTGLCPFLFWWHRMPWVPLYKVCAGLTLVFAFLLLMQVNYVLQRLAAMLPDEMLRMEAKMFSSFNILLLSVALILWEFAFAATQWPLGPSFFQIMRWLETPVARCANLLLTLLPVALTVSLIWKTKEVIFTSLCNAER
jgi:hypothetical protein